MYQLSQAIANRITARSGARSGTNDLSTLKGSTGTNIFSGIIQGEDENTIWGSTSIAVKEADMMRKSDPRVRQASMLLKTPILSATTSIRPASDDNRDILIAKFVEDQHFNSQFFRWHDVLRQQLTYFDFGHSILEKELTGIDGKMHLTRIEFRKPQTLFRWNAPNGQLETISQMNVVGDSGTRNDMLAEQVIHIAYEQEGLNFEGMSALRPAWWNWKSKQRVLAIGRVLFERLSGIPHVKVKKGTEISAEAKAVAEKLYQNEQMYLISTPQYDLDIFGLGAGGQGGGVSDAMLEFIKFNDHQIIFSVMGNFMTKGEDKVGSFALSQVNADMFFKNEEREANHIEDTWNEPWGRMKNIPQLVDENFANVTAYPKLKLEKLALDDLSSFAEQSAKLVAAGMLIPDAPLRAQVRERFDLPEEQLDSVDGFMMALFVCSDCGEKMKGREKDWRYYDGLMIHECGGTGKWIDPDVRPTIKKVDDQYWTPPVVTT